MLNFDVVAAQCAPYVAVSTLRAIAHVESSFNPHALGVVGGRLQRQPRNLLEAVATANAMNSKGIRFSAGLAQIYVKNWPALGINEETVFDPCTNLRAAQVILQSCYVRASNKEGTGQYALKQAISCYYSNNFVTGFNEGYVQRVVDAAQRFEAIGVSKTSVRQDISSN